MSKNEIKKLIDMDLNTLSNMANTIRKENKGNNIDLCAIINGRGGNCSENCKFCAQSKNHNTNIDTYGFVDENIIVNDCIRHYNSGVHRFSIVTAGRTLKGKDFDLAVSAYKNMHNKCPEMSLCASHGLLIYEQFVELKKSGVTRYHCNIETSESYFKNICTTHTFEDKINTIKAAQKAGLEICSGVIIGMGESMEDRVDMAVTLSELKVNSIPINVLNPIKNTPLEMAKPLSEDEIIRTIAIFRIANPKADIRMAAGRNKLSDNGIKAFFSGANSTITGDFLTTTGSTILKDRQMFIDNGFKL